MYQPKSAYHNNLPIVNQTPLQIPIQPKPSRINQVVTLEKLKTLPLTFKAFWCLIDGFPYDYGIFYSLKII